MSKSQPDTTAIQRQQGDPLSCYRAWKGDLGAGDALLLVDFVLQPWWQEAAAPLALTAVYCQLAGRLHVSVTDAALALTAPGPAEQYRLWLQAMPLLDLQPGRPLPLQPTAIAKPWGQEIWYTGVEERGVCCFGQGETSVPIPWVQAVMPEGLAGPAGEPLVLLKILDPVAAEVTGDLYFELHEEKREVYVVTRVDRGAWPDGIGYIRYGFDPQRVAASASEAQFRTEYRAAVAAYEAVRREIDALGGAEAPAVLNERERDLRHAMNQFTHMQPLAVGDVVVVPLLMPHSLQHGVRTIEFQTPVYERQILSFAQRVLTQDHWDTDAAVDQMRLTPPAAQPFEELPGAEGVRVERIVDFPDFEVRRVRIEPRANLELSPLPSYALAMTVEGDLLVDGMACGPEQAMLLPPRWGGPLASAQAAQPLVFLLALPRS